MVDTNINYEDGQGRSDCSGHGYGSGGGEGFQDFIGYGYGSREGCGSNMCIGYDNGQAEDGGCNAYYSGYGYGDGNEGRGFIDCSGKGEGISEISEIIRKKNNG